MPAALADRSLPAGLVLTLVENAIEHGIAPSLTGGEVVVDAWADAGDLRVRVTDDGMGLAAGWTEGTGLANCRQRLQHRGGSLEVRSQDRGTEVQLRMKGEAV